MQYYENHYQIIVSTTLLQLTKNNFHPLGSLVLELFECFHSSLVNLKNKFYQYFYRVEKLCILSFEKLDWCHNYDKCIGLSGILGSHLKGSE